MMPDPDPDAARARRDAQCAELEGRLTQSLARISTTLAELQALPRVRSLVQLDRDLDRLAALVTTLAERVTTLEAAVERLRHDALVQFWRHEHGLDEPPEETRP